MSRRWSFGLAMVAGLSGLVCSALADDSLTVSSQELQGSLAQGGLV